VGNEFYALWLDRNLQYSCGYFPTGSEDLDSAQELKMEHICRKLQLRSGERLLDIGCGWGGLARYAASRHGAKVLGVTLSKNQKAYADGQIAKSGIADVQVELMDYRDSATTFDKIVSVGMFEHVGRRICRIFCPDVPPAQAGQPVLNRHLAGWEPERSTRVLQKWIVGGRVLAALHLSGRGTGTSQRSQRDGRDAGFVVHEGDPATYALMRSWVARLAERREQVQSSDESHTGLAAT
jgi:SAM-dependent methyltransferase